MTSPPERSLETDSPAEKSPPQSQEPPPPHRSSAPLRRSRRISNRRFEEGPPPVIDLTHEPDAAARDADSPAAAAAARASADRANQVLRAYKQARSEAWNAPGLRPRHRYLEPLTGAEEEALREITRGSPDSQLLAVVRSPTGSRIALCRGDFKLLRGRRWLNDELINAYVYMINVRNGAIRSGLGVEGREDVPHTHVFSTFFYTCLVRRGYDFAGVSRWTTRAKVKVLDYDQLLFPVNLGNTHWVLCGIDVSTRRFFYLDSLHARDSHGVVLVLKRWLHDEVCEKHGEQLAADLSIRDWDTLFNTYMVKRTGVVPKEFEPHALGKGRLAMIPRQRDTGSCGVYAVKSADCLALGIKIYYTQLDMSLLRSRIALNLFSEFLPY